LDKNKKKINKIIYNNYFNRDAAHIKTRDVTPMERNATTGNSHKYSFCLNSYLIGFKKHNILCKKYFQQYLKIVQSVAWDARKLRKCSTKWWSDFGSSTIVTITTKWSTVEGMNGKAEGKDKLLKNEKIFLNEKMLLPLK
jgi:hypothetical protein